MQLTSLRSRFLAVLAGVLTLTMLNMAWGQTIAIAPTDDPAVQQLRQATLGFLEKGQWASADAAAKQLLVKDPKDGVGLNLGLLMGEQDRIDRIRQEQRQAAFKVSVGEVAGYMAKEKWTDALAEATHSADLAPTKEELAKQPWFAALIHNATTQAEDEQAKGDWLKATTTYSLMAGLYDNPRFNKYSQLAKKTTRYARLEAIYRDPKEVDKALADIDEAMLTAALESIRQYYVTEPDFKKMSVNAVECLQALTEVPSLGKVLPGLADADAKAKMRRELAQLHDQVAGMDHMGLPELSQTYIKAKRINQDSVKLPDALIIREFLDGAIESLDEFSRMIWPQNKSEFDKDMRGEFFGVGIQIALQAPALPARELPAVNGLEEAPASRVGRVGQENLELTVVSPLPKTPASRAHIHPGDVILAIDGETAMHITLDQAVHKITGKANTEVVLTLRRGLKGKPFDVHLIREKITIETVKGFNRDQDDQWDYLADKNYKIGYVRVTNFQPRTVEELDQAMNAMANQGIRGLILDLRFNPGGLLQQAVEMSDLFLDDGVIVSTRGRATPETVERAHAGGNKTELPLVVLVNDYSASAAEIVTGALKDHNRAIVVGDRSFGKGSVQNVIPIGRENGLLSGPKEALAYLKLTTAGYYLPSGRSLHRHEDSQTWGVDPAVAVKVTRDELEDILDLRRDSDVLHMLGEAPTSQPEPAAPAGSTTRPERTRVDPQLEAGLMVMRAELLKNKI